MKVIEKDICSIDKEAIKTLRSFIENQDEYTISNKALYTGFQHRSKVEFLKFFIV